MDKQVRVVLNVVKGWVGGPYAPKVIIRHQKVIISPKKCALIPQNRSFNHIPLTFSLKKMIYALLSKDVAFTRCCWPNSPRCQD